MNALSFLYVVQCSYHKKSFGQKKKRGPYAIEAQEFVVVKSEILSTGLFTDLTLEQEIKVSKCHRGMIRLRKSCPRLPSYNLTESRPHGKAISQQLSLVSKASEWNEHYRHCGDVAGVIAGCHGNQFKSYN